MAVTALTVALMVAGAAAPAAAAIPREGGIGGGVSVPGTGRNPCVPVWPGNGFYEAGRVASALLTVPLSACTTISVSDIRDAANPSDRCQTFLVGFFPSDGTEPTYTEPVTACAVPPSTQTVLARNVPDGMVYRVLYNIDYLQPALQQVRYKVWH